MRKTIFILFLIFCTFFVFSQRMKMRKTGIEVEYDDFTNTKKTTLNIIADDLKSMSECSIGFIELKSENETKYLIYTYVYKTDWIFVEKLVFKIDNQTYEFESFDNIRETENVFGGGVQETNYYETTKDFIEMLSNSKSIQARIYGEHYYINPNIKSKQIKEIKNFINKINE